MLGSAVVERLPKLLDDESEKSRIECADRMAHAFKSFLNDSADQSAARSIFEIYRKFDLKSARSGQNSTDAELKSASASLVADIASSIQGIPQATIKSFVDQHWALYKEERATLFAARSRASHVSAVLRPFHKRYSGPFLAVLNNDSEANGYRSSIEDLLHATISTQLELEAWWHDVWILFAGLAVYRADTENDRPVGMIGPGSVRTYRQQWNSWFSQNKSLLFELGSLASTDSSQIDEAEPQGKFAIEGVELQQDSEAKVSLSELAIEVSSIEGNVSVTKRWPSVGDIDESRITTWINSVLGILAMESSALQVGLSATRGKENLTVSFEASSAESAAARAMRLCSAFIA